MAIPEGGSRLTMTPQEGSSSPRLWQDSGTGNTRMTLRNRGEPSGFSKLIAPLVGSAVRKANQKDLLRLKRLLESNEDQL